MTRSEYIDCLGDLLSGDPDRVRTANRQIFTAAVKSAMMGDAIKSAREADIALAEAAGRE